MKDQKALEEIAVYILEILTHFAIGAKKFKADADLISHNFNLHNFFFRGDGIRFCLRCQSYLSNSVRNSGGAVTPSKIFSYCYVTTTFKVALIKFSTAN